MPVELANGLVIGFPVGLVSLGTHAGQFATERFAVCKAVLRGISKLGQPVYVFRWVAILFGLQIHFENLKKYSVMQLPNQAKPIQRKRNYSIRSKSLSIQMSDDDMENDSDDEEDDDTDTEGNNEGGEDEGSEDEE